MKVVSRYVREQKRYTKNDLKSKFSFDEDGVEKFIKNLKAYGVLKSVKNTDDQLEMSDLVDDDVEITDETAESGDCLYVFTYVGVITCGSRVIKVYPKYLLSKKDDNVLDEMKQIVKVLERYSRSEEQIGICSKCTFGTNCIRSVSVLCSSFICSSVISNHPPQAAKAVLLFFLSGLIAAFSLRTLLWWR